MSNNTEEKKRNSVNGYDRESMSKKLQNLRRYGADWRKVGSETVVMTVLRQCFSHTSGVETIIKHLCPWGMREVMTKFLTEKRCLNKNVLPLAVKEDHPLLVQELYNKSEWKVSVANEGAMKAEKYHHLYCSHCKHVLVPKLIEEYRDGLGDATSIVGLINNWDALKIPSKIFGLC